ncbi:cytochrome c [Flavobacterium franklandianum]|uniref:c-type cytochrome n=1 Tax=Flavobacterium franklandianum TaxID=2594430 RepID=UPI00117BC4D6|nr:cytochrome c [Flavobacterium franklandianum]TRX24836.1 cytochrome c [Flavobacterium franklandianum]
MILNKIYFWFSPILLGFLFIGFSESVSNRSIQSDYLVLEQSQNKTDLQKSIARGKEVYADFCMQCHLATGKGDLVNFPPLDGSDWLVKKRKQSIHAVKYGQTGEVIVKGKKFNNIMPPLGLSNQEVADVMNFVMNSWSNKQKKMVTIDEVKAVIN